MGKIQGGEMVAEPTLTEKSSERKIAWIERIEWVAAILLTATVLSLVIARTVNAGPLWRDECDSLQLARMPRFVDLLRHLQFTGFPILFPITVRMYTRLFGTTDIALRCFGLAAAIFFLGAAWFQSSSFNRAVPLLVPALIGLNVHFLTAGLWLRGYGLGCALIVVAFALTAKFLMQPSAAKLITACLAYLASMHCLYFNGVLVPAMVVAAAVVLLVRREWKWTWILLIAAAGCGLSYLPYVWKIYSSTITWAVIVQMPFSWSWSANRFLAACNPDWRAGIVWQSIVLLCIIPGFWRLKSIWSTNRIRERDLLLFALVVIPVGILAQFGFLRLMRNIIIPRYYLTLMSLIAAAATVIVANISSRCWSYFGRIVVVVMALSMLLFIPWRELHERNSNIDMVTQRLEKEAFPNDLIVLSDAQLGISFNHYYHGKNRWITAPEIDDHRIHRYDLMQKKMTEFFPLDDVEKEVAATLKSGNRVWIAGTFGRPSRSASVLAPAPDPEFGWQLPAYIDAWSRQLGTFVRRHAGRVDMIVPRGKFVSEWENPPLIACQGWKY